MISVVMATYNQAPTLMRAVNSMLAQSLQDWELIIVNDGSTDETPQILAAIDDPRVRIFSHPKNRGVAAAKNIGMDQICGEWFTGLDSDDELTPDGLAVMLECAERTGATAISCNCLDTVTGEMSGFGPKQDGWVTAAEVGSWRGGFFGLTKASLLGNLRLDERLPGFEDTIWLKINPIARRYYLHRALLIYHKEGENRICVTSGKASIRRKAQVYRALGEDAAYLAALRAQNPRGYRHKMLRIYAARLLKPLLGEP
jgi:glycosyltransferase involved in cell wall biosynthesis